MKSAPWKTVFWIVVVGLAAGGLAFPLVDNAKAWRAGSRPATPVTLAGLGKARADTWLLVDGAQLVCPRESNSTVPLVDVDHRLAAAVQLRERTFCEGIPRGPLLVRTGGTNNAVAALRQRLGGLGDDAGNPLELATPLVLHEGRGELEHVRDETFALALIVLCLLLVEGFLVVTLRKKRAEQARRSHAAGGIHSAVGVPSDADVLASLAAGTQVSADEPLFAGPIRLSEAARRRSWMQRTLGVPALWVACVGSAGLGVASGVDIALDGSVWTHGTEVPSKVRGNTTRYQGLVVHTELDVLYLAAPDDTRQTSVSFWTWFAGPGDEIGSVRMMPGDPERIVVENAVDAWPWRLFCVLGWALCAALLGVAARQARIRAGMLETIAREPEEALLLGPRVTEMRVNGVRSAWRVDGILDGVPVSLSLASSVDPGTLVTSRPGALVVIRARSRPSLRVLVHDDLEPFDVDGRARARAQAILSARGSPTRLRA